MRYYGVKGQGLTPTVHAQGIQLVPKGFML